MTPIHHFPDIEDALEASPPRSTLISTPSGYMVGRRIERTRGLPIWSLLRTDGLMCDDVESDRAMMGGVV